MSPRHPLPRALTAVVVSALATTSPLRARADEPAGDQHELPPVAVSAGAPAPGLPLYQAADVDVVTGKEKERREGASLGETLRHLPGVGNISTGNTVGKPVIRGLSGNRIQILSNGVGVDHQQFGVRHTPNIDPFLSDRIEVVRGASSLQYGSGALGGAIDVSGLALDFAAPGERETGGEALFGYSDNNHQKDIGWKAFQRGGRWSLVGGVIRRDAGDITTPDEHVYFPPPPAPQHRDAPAYSGKLDYTDFEQTSGQLGLGHRADWGEISLRYGGWRDEHNFLLPPPGGQLPPGQGPEGIGQNLENDEIQLSANIDGAPGWQWVPTLSWQNNLRQSNQAGTPRADLFDGNIELEFKQYTARLEARHPALAGFDFGTLGVELKQKDQYSRGTTTLVPGGKVRNAALFAFEQKEVSDRVTLQAGLRHDFHETTGDASRTRGPTPFQGRDENRYSATSGSLGGVYRFTDHLVLATNLAAGFRAPSLFELYAGGVHGGVAAVQQGNPDLDEERSLGVDLALRWQSPRWSASATVYRNRINDYIYQRDTGTTDPDAGLPVFAFDQDDATLEGFELQASGKVTDWLEMRLGYSTVDGENRETGQDLGLLPADEATLEGTWLVGAWGPVSDSYLRLGLRHDASKDAAPGEPFAQFDGAPFGTASTDSYTVADLAAGVEFGGTPTRPVRLDLEIRNLTDKAYRDFLDTYKGYALSAGRDVRLTLRVPFGG
ncbi:outer membrane receptor protein [Alcanivorax sp. 521-1]|uniref:Outer membrane receptor protein n=2 Tax=Alloalcanivorax profundimaris TaxID=2735259 RepID=A0ABS0ALN4_9GAMM|nr:outer membrane receptor protein [Alloalcanivorax profundimaris]